MRDSGLEGFRTKEIQERRIKDKRYPEQERSWTGGIQARCNAGQVGYRTGACRKEECRKEGCRKAGVHE